MGLKRLLLELLVALLFAQFAMLVGDAYAAEPGCGQGLPALSGESSMLEHEIDRQCVAAVGVDSFGGSDGNRR